MEKNKQITYNNILNEWLSTKNDIKLQSLLNYENMIKGYLTDTIGNMEIKKLKKEIVENLFQNLKDSTSITTRKKLIYIIKSSLSYAYRHNYIDYMDLSNITFKTNNRTIFVLSKEEQLKLEDKLKDRINIRKICVILCLYTGLRVGEVAGLKWEDIDFSNKSLCIKRTIERIKNKNTTNSSKTILIESTPKSETSNRIVPIPNFIIELLNTFPKKHNAFLLSNSEKLYDPRLLESFYSRILKKCNIKHNKFHTLRHTFATRSIESKMDIKTLSEILGHSSIEITLKLYVHPSYELKKNSIENLVQFMIHD